MDREILLLTYENLLEKEYQKLLEYDKIKQNKN